MMMNSPCEMYSKEGCKEKKWRCGAWCKWFASTWDRLCALARRQWGYWNSEDEP